MSSKTVLSFDSKQTQPNSGPPPAGTCPRCATAADLQDRTRDVWWCARCRFFFDSQGVNIPPISLPHPMIAETSEAENLASDLLAAGCQFIEDGEYFQIKLPPKIKDDLLARWNAIDSKKLRQAAQRVIVDQNKTRQAA